MYISIVHVMRSYFQGREDGHFADDYFFVIRTSKVWDLANPEQRIEAGLAFLAILKYVMD